LIILYSLQYGRMNGNKQKQQKTREHWIQRITFAADGVQSRLGGHTHTHKRTPSATIPYPLLSSNEGTKTHTRHRGQTHKCVVQQQTNRMYLNSNAY